VVPDAADHKRNEDVATLVAPLAGDDRVTGPGPLVAVVNDHVAELVVPELFLATTVQK
jgi:hypothetical protein